MFRAATIDSLIGLDKLFCLPKQFNEIIILNKKSFYSSHVTAFHTINSLSSFVHCSVEQVKDAHYPFFFAQ